MSSTKVIFKEDDLYIQMKAKDYNPTYPKTLREYFIGQALAGLCANKFQDTECIDLAVESINIADSVMEILKLHEDKK